MRGCRRRKLELEVEFDHYEHDDLAVAVVAAGLDLRKSGGYT